eukprot:scaffold318254_cov33-Tisochrysis_lutea.AAC.3
MIFLARICVGMFPRLLTYELYANDYWQSSGHFIETSTRPSLAKIRRIFLLTRAASRGGIPTSVSVNQITNYLLLSSSLSTRIPSRSRAFPTTNYTLTILQLQSNGVNPWRDPLVSKQLQSTLPSQKLTPRARRVAGGRGMRDRCTAYSIGSCAQACPRAIAGLLGLGNLQSVVL